MAKKTAPEAEEQPVASEIKDAPESSQGGPDAPESPSESDANDPRDAEIAALQGKLARARADYDNLQKRTQRDAGMERERVKARVLEPFIQVFEYGRMAVVEADKSPGPLAEGVKMVVNEFERLLSNEGVKPMGAVGEAFDSSRHEAIAEEEAEGVAPGHISRVIQPGYLLDERVLRYAKVAVAPGPSQE